MKTLHEESHQTRSPSSLTACSRQRSIPKAKGRMQKQGIQIPTCHQHHLVRNREIRKMQMLLPALLQSQPAAGCDLPPQHLLHQHAAHDVIFTVWTLPHLPVAKNPKAMTTDEFHSDSANALLSNCVRICRPSRNQGILQGLYKVRTAALVSALNNHRKVEAQHTLWRFTFLGKVSTISLTTELTFRAKIASATTNEIKPRRFLSS